MSRDTTPLAERQHVVYRFYDAAGGLLYVGMTSDLPARLRQHAGEKPWWPDVARIESQSYQDQAAAASAELAGIIGDHPRYNRDGAATSLDDLVEAVRAHVRRKRFATIRSIGWRAAASITRLPAAVGILATVAWTWIAAWSGAKWVGLELPWLVGAAVGFAIGAWMVGELHGWLTFVALMILPVTGQMYMAGVLDRAPELVRAGLWTISHISLMVALGLALAGVSAYARQHASAAEAGA